MDKYSKEEYVYSILDHQAKDFVVQVDTLTIHSAELEVGVNAGTEISYTLIEWTEGYENGTTGTFERCPLPDDVDVEEFETELTRIHIKQLRKEFS